MSPYLRSEISSGHSSVSPSSARADDRNRSSYDLFGLVEHSGLFCFVRYLSFFSKVIWKLDII
jgi:hypothetical protein